MSQHTRDHATRLEPFDPPRLADPAESVEEITAFIEATVDAAGADGVVVNLSGGIDSTVSATLATEALGSEHVSALVLPADANTDENVTDARHVAEELAVDYRVVNIQPTLDRFVRALSSETREVTRDPMNGATQRVTSSVKGRSNYREAVGNLAARIRMMAAYFEANTTSRLVLGTGNRTELLLGYFTKYGDGGVDLLPIGDLYKTEVRDLARHLDVHERVVEKEPTAGLWTGQADETDLSATYPAIDSVLHRLFDDDMDIEETAATVGVEADRVERFAEMAAASRHKRNPPPSPGLRPVVPDETVTGLATDTDGGVDD